MNIAVFLPNWIGDAVMATPAIVALRRHFPGSQFVAVLKPYVQGVIEGNTWFQEHLFANDGTWKNGIIPVARRLRQRKIDLAILFPGSFRSAMTAWLGRCRQRVGIARDLRRLLLTAVLQEERD